MSEPVIPETGIGMLPMSNVERILAYMAGVEGVTLPEPESRVEAWLKYLAENGGGGGGEGTKNYNQLQNKPKINDVELAGNKSLDDLGIASAENLAEAQDDIDDLQESISSLDEEKVDNTFPTTDAGKVLGIGSDGKVAPQESSGGEPQEYIKDASASGDTLTLTKKDDSIVTFTKPAVTTHFNSNSSAAASEVTGDAIGRVHEMSALLTNEVTMDFAGMSGEYIWAEETVLSGTVNFKVNIYDLEVYSGATHISFKAGANCNIVFDLSDYEGMTVLWANGDVPQFEEGKIYDIVISRGYAPYVYLYASYTVYTEPTA